MLKLYLLIIGCVIGAAVLLTLSISYAIYRMAFYTNRKKHIKLFDKLEGELDENKKYRRALIEKMIAEPCEDVYIQSHDGLKLHGRLYRRDKDAPLSIMMHGYKSISLRDMSGGGKEALALGHNLLLVDQRAHGESEGRVISFGINERYDALGWVDFGIREFGPDVKIILTGISMGAGTVLMASELGLPKNVVGICADCPFSTPVEIIKKVGRDMKMPAGILTPFIIIAARLFGGFSINAASSIEAVKNTDIPILLIHSKEDKFVPIEMSDKIAECGRTVEYIVFPEGGHGMSYIFDTEKYVYNLKKFINSVTENDKGEKL